MAQRGKPDSRGRTTARPASGRRVEGRREARRDTRRAEARRESPAAVTDPVSADTDVRDDARVGVGAAMAGRVRGLSPKRAVVLALVCGVVALTLAVPLRTYFSQRSEFDELRTTNAGLRQEVSQYQAKVDEQADPANIMAQARERLQFVMPGDKALVMQYPPAPEKSDEEKAAEAQANNPWFTNLFGSVSTPPRG